MSNVTGNPNNHLYNNPAELHTYSNQQFQQAEPSRTQGVFKTAERIKYLSIAVIALGGLALAVAGIGSTALSHAPSLGLNNMTLVGGTGLLVTGGGVLLLKESYTQKKEIQEDQMLKEQTQQEEHAITMRPRQKDEEWHMTFDENSDVIANFFLLQHAAHQTNKTPTLPTEGK